MQLVIRFPLRISTIRLKYLRRVHSSLNIQIEFQLFTFTPFDYEK